MTVFLYDSSTDRQSVIPKAQSSAVTKEVAPISQDEAKTMARAIVEEITVAKARKPEIVIASYFGGEEGEGKDLHGQKMANGEIYDMYKTEPAGHLRLPFRTKVTLVSPYTKEEVVVTIKTRGPYVDGRQFDLSWAAADKLGFIDNGVASLLVTRIEPPPDSGLSQSEAYAML